MQSTNCYVLFFFTILATASNRGMEVPGPSTFVSRKRMKDGSVKQYTCQRSALRRTVSLTFPSEDDITTFDTLLNGAKAAYKGEPISAILTRALRSLSETPHGPYATPARANDAFATSCETSLLLCDTAALFKMLETLENHKQSCSETLLLEKVTSCGFGSRLHWRCNEHSFTLLSSSISGDLRTVDCHLAIAFICSGMLPVQFQKFCEFSSLPYSPRALDRATTKIKAAVSLLRMESLSAAQQEECRASEPPSVPPTMSIETDARHACRKNSYHSDVVALGQKTHKVVGIVHVTKNDEISSQKHEVVGTKKLYEYFDAKGIQLKDHAHDRNTSVNKIIRERNGTTTNTNDRWHAAKSIKKGMMSIASGPKKTEGKTWHQELSDKCQPVRNHAYFAMATCGGNADNLRETLLNCVNHFSGDHRCCASDSQCKSVGHVPSTLLLKDAVAIDLLTKFIRSTTVYKSAQDFVRSKDTFYVESFNNTVLMYLDKRIHYKNETYDLRQSLAVLDWNEHVGRASTSVYRMEDCRHPDKQGGKKNYCKKSYR